jgi:putative transcriptional regulator
MWLNPIVRLVLVLAAMLLPAVFGRAALPTTAEAPERGSLAGQLLIASPNMADTRFEHAVVLMVRHNQDGALGIVINRPVGQQPLTALLHALGEDQGSATETVAIYLGGPVEASHGFVVHSAEYHRAETLDIDGHVAMTASLDIFRDIANKIGPQKSLIAFGYAGWGPGQLEAELAHNAWFTAPEDPALVFDDARGQVWEHALRRRTQDL